jgi:hypothetical protein
LAIFPIIDSSTAPRLTQVPNAPHPGAQLVRRCKRLRFERDGQFKIASTAVLRMSSPASWSPSALQRPSSWTPGLSCLDTECTCLLSHIRKKSPFSGICNEFAHEERIHSFLIPLDCRHVMDYRLTLFVSGSAWDARFGALFQVAMETFIGVCFRPPVKQMRGFDRHIS